MAPKDAQEQDGGRQAEATAKKAAQKELSGDYDEAFRLYVSAVQSFLHAAGTTSDPRLQSKWKVAAKTALDRAEKIKAAKRDLRPVKRDRFAKEQQAAVLDRSSRVNGLRFPIWKASDDEYDSCGHSKFNDPDGHPALSKVQEACLAGWKSPEEIFTAYAITSDSLQPQDILQETITDCSVVAALAVCLQHNARRRTKLGVSAVHPQGSDGLPLPSSTGIYSIVLKFNGALRLIDDRLPLSKDGRLLCVSTTGKNILWPCLVEKAYLKVMGGYDFEGSNGSIDLHAITGWIPEHLQIMDSKFRRENAWTRLRLGFTRGDCLITVGTGKVPGMYNEHYLSPYHAYAVIDVQDDDEHRLLALWNPWGDRVERGVATSPLSGGLLRINWDDLCTRFDSIYLNWDPQLFSHQIELHSAWQMPQQLDAEGNWTANHQFTITVTQASPTDAEVWVLLSRHISGNQDQKSFIATHVLHALEADSSSVKKPTLQTTYTDSPHVLVRTARYSEEKTLTVIASRHGPGTEEVAYSLTVFCHTPFVLSEPQHKYPFTKSVEGAFTIKTAGGNATHATFMQNPQYALTIRRPTGARAIGGKDIAPTPELRLSVHSSKDIPLHAQIMWGRGQRVSDIQRVKVLRDSGNYTYGFALCETTIEEGTYTVVVSSFDPAQTGPYKLEWECSHPFDIDIIPQEGAGMFSKKVVGTWEGNSAPGRNKSPTYELTLSATTDLTLRLMMITTAAATAIKISIHKSSKLNGPEMATSGPFTDSVSGAFISSLHVEPGTYLLRPSIASLHVKADFQILLYSSNCAIICRAL